MLKIPKKLTKHDHYTDILSKRVGNDYDIVLKGVPIYSKRNRLVGEIDLLGVKGDYCDIYEVKCSHRITKAKLQLRKLRKLVSGRRVRRTYFFCGEAGKLVRMSV